jgi:hypothetical protein
MRIAVELAITGNLAATIENGRRFLSGGGARVLLPRPRLSTGSWSARRINVLVRRLPRAMRYLEIGVYDGGTLENIVADSRWGVDPVPRFDTSRLPDNVEFFEETSDEFFLHLNRSVTFDVVFIDGLHTFDQAYRDLINALSHIEDGVILLDDTVPSDEVSAIPDHRQSLARRKEIGLQGGPWYGDVWKVVVCLARNHPELDYRTIIGSGNPQTLVWRRQAGLHSVSADANELSGIAQLSYRAMFSDGLPDLFRSSDEQDALSRCLTTVAPRRAQQAGDAVDRVTSERRTVTDDPWDDA